MFGSFCLGFLLALAIAMLLGGIYAVIKAAEQFVQAFPMVSISIACVAFGMLWVLAAIVHYQGG